MATVLGRALGTAVGRPVGDELEPPPEPPEDPPPPQALEVPTLEVTASLPPPTARVE